MFLAKTGIVPTKISALGIEFTQADRHSILYALSAIVIYFLIAFITYAVTDFILWRIALIHARNEIETLDREVFGNVGKEIRKEYKIYTLTNAEQYFINKLSLPASIVRAIFEFLLPISFGIFAIYVLWTTPISENNPATSSIKTNQSIQNNVRATSQVLPSQAPIKDSAKK